MTPMVQDFVMHIGEMGSRWGLNRTLGQMCGLLFVSPEPLNADEIAGELHISRSNVSMGLKELKTWRLVKPASVPGDRREYWTTPDDVWEIFRVLAEERRRREIDPTLSMLREALVNKPTTDDEQHAQRRMREMHDLLELTTNWIDEVHDLPPRTLTRLLKLGKRVQTLLKSRREKRRAGSKTEPAKG